MNNITTLDLIRSTKGKFFTVEFIKTNGEKRKMNARIGVQKNLTGTGQSWSPAERNMITVFDMQKHDYRIVNLSTLQSFKCGSTVWTAPQLAVAA